MPAIPQYTARNTPQGTLGVRNVDLGAEQIARGVGALGAGLREVSAGQFAIQDANQEKIQRDELVSADALFATFQERFNTKAKKRQLDAPLDVKDFTPELQKEYDKDFSELMKGIRNPIASQLLRGRGMVFRERVTGDATLFEATQGIKNRTTQVVTAGEARELQLDANPSLYGELLGQQKAIIESAGLPPDVTREQLLNSKERMATAAVTSQVRDNPIKILQALHAEPGKSGNQAIEDLSPDGREAMRRFARAEFSQLVANRAAQDAAEERAERERHELGERNATLGLLRGTLTLADLQEGVRNDSIDPTTARTLATAMKTGDATTDSQTLFNAKANLLSFSETEIRDMPGISWKDKSQLIEDRRQADGTWQDSNEYQEAVRRIDGELKIPPGSVIAALPPETLEARGRALTALYNNVSQLPLEERRAGAIQQSELVIQEVIRSNARKEADRLRAQLKNYKQKIPDPNKLSKSGRAAYDQTIDSLSRRILEAESK